MEVISLNWPFYDFVFGWIGKLITSLPVPRGKIWRAGQSQKNRSSDTEISSFQPHKSVGKAVESERWRQWYEVRLKHVGRPTMWQKIVRHAKQHRQTPQGIQSPVVIKRFWLTFFTFISNSSPVLYFFLLWSIDSFKYQMYLRHFLAMSFIHRLCVQANAFAKIHLIVICLWLSGGVTTLLFLEAGLQAIIRRRKESAFRNFRFIHFSFFFVNENEGKDVLSLSMNKG